MTFSSAAGIENVAFQRQQVFIGDSRGARHPHDGAGALLIAISLERIDSARIQHAAPRVADRHDLCLFLGKDARRRGAHISITLHRHARPAQRHLFQLTGFLDGKGEAPSRGIRAAFRAAQRHGLAGNTPERGFAGQSGIRIHHPGHRLGICRYIRSRNVSLRSQNGHDFVGESPRQPLQFGSRHPLRVADHSAFRAAVRNVHRRRLPRHPRSQRLHLVQREIRMVANAPLRRSSSHVVLHAIPGENLYLAVIQLDGNGDFHHSLGGAQNLPQSRVDLQKLGGHIELHLSDAERIEIFPRSDFRNHRLRHSFGHRSHPPSPSRFGARCAVTSRPLPRAQPAAHSVHGTRTNRSV